MSNLSDFGERSFIDYALRRQAAPATTYYLGVSTQAFAEDDTPAQAAAKEPTDSNYARRSVSFGNASSRTISNDTDIEFPEAGASQGSIGYWALFDGTSSTANTVVQGTFTTAKTVATGDVLRVATGDLDISVSSIWGIHWADRLLNGFFGDQTATSSKDKFSNTTNDNDYFVSNTNSAYYEYSQYYNYYLGVAGSAFDMTKAANLLGGSIQSYNSSTSISADEKTNIDKEPWAPTSPSPTFATIGDTYDLKGYARTQISFSAASTTTGTTTMVNSSAVSFPEATSSWGSIAYWAIFAQQTASNQGATLNDFAREDIHNLFFPIIGGSFTTAKSILSGDVLRINAGDFILTPR